MTLPVVNLPFPPGLNYTVEPQVDDDSMMRAALALARRGAGRTSPNPMVGAVVARGGKVLGRGWHRGPGSPHAEVEALAGAGRARGATMYTTLEPCAHQGLTPPCVEAIKAAGIARVVAAMLDPDPRVQGRGVAALMEAGIGVEVGMREAQAGRLNEAYVLHRSRGRPFVTCKAALSLDGRVAASDGSSRWITGPAARLDAHRFRALSDAILVGVGTVLADDPALTVRGVPRHRNPLRVVVDLRGRSPETAQVFSPEAPALLVAGPPAPAAKLRRLEGRGVQILRMSGAREEIPGALLAEMGRRGIVSVLLEGGPSLAGSFAAAGLIDRYLLYLAPILLGDPAGGGLLRGWAAGSIGDARPLQVDEVRRVGEDLRVLAYPAPAS